MATHSESNSSSNSNSLESFPQYRKKHFGTDNLGLAILNQITQKTTLISDESSEIGNMVFGPHLINIFSSSTNHLNEPLPKFMPLKDKNAHMNVSPMVLCGPQLMKINTSSSSSILNEALPEGGTPQKDENALMNIAPMVQGPQLEIVNISSPSSHLSTESLPECCTPKKDENAHMNISPMVHEPQLNILNISSSSSSHLSESLPKCDTHEKDQNVLVNSSDSHDNNSVRSKQPDLLPVPSNPSCEIPVAITASEILTSEDYTRVTFNGPNPKITHIFDDFRLECLPNYQLMVMIRIGKEREEVISVYHQVATYQSGSNSYPSLELLNFCEACNKTLEEGKDIYIFRGNSSFCSTECLAVGILAEEITKAAANKASSQSPSPSCNCLPFGSQCFH